MPMVEVMGTDGNVALVYRPWPENDMREAAKHFPDPKEDSEDFVAQFRSFLVEFKPTTAEIKRLIILKWGQMGAGRITMSPPT